MEDGTILLLYYQCGSKCDILCFTCVCAIVARVRVISDHLGGGWFAETLRKLGGGSPRKDNESLHGEKRGQKFRIFALRK